MEIERKFLIDAFPDLPLVQEAVVLQGYLCTCPVVRIRSTCTEDGTRFKLCFKGKGDLAREEIEMDLSEDTFERLRALIEGCPLVRKDYKAYRLPDGLLLECSLVDSGETTEFMYAEVEFSSIEQAQAFTPPAFLGREVTYDPSFSMGRYWEKKKQMRKG